MKQPARAGPWPLPVAILALLQLGCGADPHEMTVTAPLSAPPNAPGSGLSAGFGRADITPPPGIGLNGNGPEGHQAQGYRHRLYARAMVLQGANGERIAYLVADLPHVSPILHRLTAAAVHPPTGIGADRLIVSATHTHSGPGNFYEAKLYNDNSGRLPGYDTTMVQFLVDGFSRAVRQAVDDLRPAVASWVSDTIYGLTRNRSLNAFLLNESPITKVTPGAPPTTQQLEAVDPVWTMLRVDQCDAGWTNCAPRGAFSVFAIHGTGFPPAHRLVDGDIHGVVERGLEREIETLNGALGSSRPDHCPAVDEAGEPVSGTGACRFASRAMHLFANGTEGDISPNHLPGSRCGEEEPADRELEERLRLRRARRPSGPKTPPGIEEWLRRPGRSDVDCLAIASRSVDSIGDRLVGHARDMFARAAQALSKDIDVRRTFTTVDLRSPPVDSLLCSPLTGTSTYGGAEDARTRLHRWKFLGFIPSGMEEGAIDESMSGCDGPKLPGVGPFQKFLVRKYGLPRFAQFSVVQIGDGLVAATPFEITTEAGRRMKQAMRSAGPFSPAVSHVAIVGLANGYLQYLTTPEEYQAQAYEGGSTLYGSRTAQFVQAELAALARSLTEDDPIVRLDTIVALPGPERSFFPRRDRGPDPAAIPRRVMALTCGPISLPPGDPKDPTAPRVTAYQFRARWVDAYPGTLAPSEGQVIEIQRRTGDVFQPVAWDDGFAATSVADADRTVAVRAVGPGAGAFIWEVVWISHTIEPGHVLRLVLQERTGVQDGRVVERLPRPGFLLAPPYDEVVCASG
ncbi:MAG: neutral/alkaline non-lysosomal ceramidase N-terminal domain-containing protein [Gemmatimonadetes bacterium]|nr:neutral/alkaline non-lysosomal ceramidase N-terminal domain-containing protein [Gemmatimonadota bacterium]